MLDGRFPPELLFSASSDQLLAANMRAKANYRPKNVSANFQTVSWTSQSPLVLAAFQEAIGRISENLVRAKGFVTFEERRDEPMLFQLVGNRATLGRAPTRNPETPAVELVFIAQHGALDERTVSAILDDCRTNRENNCC